MGRERSSREPSTAPRSVEKHSRDGPRNCRSLGYARDDKGERGAPLKSGCWMALFITCVSAASQENLTRTVFAATLFRSL